VTRPPAGAAAMILLAAACGAAPPTRPAATPAAGGPAVSGPRVAMPSGAVYAVELARKPEEQAQGLMYRENLPARTGMLFLFPEPAPHQFWMKNTMIPLDIVWMDPENRVLFVSANTPPCKADPCPTYGPAEPAKTVLEIAGGMAAREAIVTGAKLQFLDIR
jgi:uncharacterized membrane protein (UPF0127 family)